MEKRDVMNTEPKGLEASLHHLLQLHHHNSLILTHQTGLPPFLFSLFKIGFWFVNFPFPILIKSFFFSFGYVFVCRKSEERCNKESGASFGSVGGSSKWWGARIILKPETNWAWNSNSCYHYYKIHETNRSMACCFSFSQHCSQGTFFFSLSCIFCIFSQIWDYCVVFVLLLLFVDFWIYLLLCCTFGNARILVGYALSLCIVCVELWIKRTLIMIVGMPFLGYFREVYLEMIIVVVCC